MSFPERPWLVGAAVECLEKTLSADMRVFEYGSGGSTVFFARRCSEVVSVDHEARWTERTLAALRDRGLTNASVHLCEPERAAGPADPRDPQAYASGRLFHGGLRFRAYAGFIDRFPDASFDIVLIDGRARPSCFLHALPKLKSGGYLGLDDAERSRYAAIGRTLAEKRWAFTEFAGWRPRRFYRSKTCFWRKPF